MAERLTPQQVANLLRRLAEQIEELRIPTQLRIYADEIAPSELPEPNRTSHFS